MALRTLPNELAVPANLFRVAENVRRLGFVIYPGLGSLGNPSTISPMMLRCTWLVPA